VARIAYFDCFSGAAGDMIVAALLDAGVSLDDVRSDLDALNLGGFSVEATRIKKQGFGATYFKVNVDAATEQPHRHLKHIRAILDASRLPEPVRTRALRVFERLAEAEAKAHASTVESVHFHEVGAIDAIVDVAASVLALDRLAIDRIVCSPIPTGSGTVVCAHGVMPVPAPGTAELLRGVPLAECDEPGELTTPTGAAILTALASGYGPLPAMTVASIGYGAGTRDGKTRPNLLRVMIGTDAAEPEQDEIVVLQANLDDASPQVIGHAMERLLEAGVLDVYCQPIYMKKLRPAQVLTVLCAPEQVAAVEELIFAETTTFGVRRQSMRRAKLAREFATVMTPFGQIRMKLGRRGGRIVTATPEYEDCRAVARAAGVPLRDVIQAAAQSYAGR